jgi:hypothetical protein
MLDPANGVAKGGGGRKPFPAATPSWTLAPLPRSKHEERPAGMIQSDNCFIVEKITRWDQNVKQVYRNGSYGLL